MSSHISDSSPPSPRHQALLKPASMMALILCAMVVILVTLIVRWVAAVPLIHTLSMTIDNWADSVHGADALD